MKSKKSLKEVLEMAVADLQQRLYEPNQRPSTITLSQELVKLVKENDWAGEGVELPDIQVDKIKLGRMGSIKLHVDSSLILTEFAVEDSMQNKWIFLYEGEPVNRLYMQRNLTCEPSMLIIGEDFEWPGIPGLPKAKRT